MDPLQKIKSESFNREIDFSRSQVNEEKRTVEVAFSSEAPVQRWFGNEILDHSAEAVDLGRLSRGGAVLVDHDHTDQVGVVESVTIDADRKGRAVLRFGNSARASEIFQDIKDGIRSLVSVGYRVLEVVLEKQNEEGDDYRITRWEPYEISMVSVPADTSVGVGRSEEKIKPVEIPKVVTMDPKDVQEAKDKELEQRVADASKFERDRIRTINGLGSRFEMKDLAERAVESGLSSDAFQSQVLEELSKRNNVEIKEAESADIGLTEKEVKQFSFLRALNALANPTSHKAQEAAAFEFECSRAASDAAKKESQGVRVPVDVLKRDLTVGTDTAGGHTVSTDLLAQNFIELLRNNTVVYQRATQLTGLNGNIAIPRQTGGATAYWVTEGSEPTESQQSFDQVALAPKTVGAYTEYSRKLLRQSSIDVEGFVRGDLAKTLGLELDRVAINGSGTDPEPEGILNVSGIGSVSCGSPDGGAPTWGDIVDLESEVANDNAAVGNLAYITNTKVRGKLKQTEKASGTAQFIWDGTTMNGYQTLVTNQVPSNLAEGASGNVLSAIIYGNLSDLIVALWSGLDLMVDPYALSKSGGVRVIALQDVDMAVRHAESFAAIVDAITT